MILVEVMAPFAERVRELRLQAGISLRETDRRAGLGEGHTQAVEAGKKDNPTLETLESYARAFGVRVSDLVDATALTGTGS